MAGGGGDYSGGGGSSGGGGDPEDPFDWTGLGLDVAGVIADAAYGAGAVFDAVSAARYFDQGKYLQSAFSAIAMIPVVGDVIGKGARYGGQGANVALRHLIVRHHSEVARILFQVGNRMGPMGHKLLAGAIETYVKNQAVGGATRTVEERYQQYQQDAQYDKLIADTKRTKLTRTSDVAPPKSAIDPETGMPIYADIVPTGPSEGLDQDLQTKTATAAPEEFVEQYKTEEELKKLVGKVPLGEDEASPVGDWEDKDQGAPSVRGGGAGPARVAVDVASLALASTGVVRDEHAQEAQGRRMQGLEEAQKLVTRDKDLNLNISTPVPKQTPAGLEGTEFTGEVEKTPDAQVVDRDAARAKEANKRVDDALRKADRVNDPDYVRPTTAKEDIQRHEKKLRDRAAAGAEEEGRELDKMLEGMDKKERAREAREFAEAEETLDNLLLHSERSEKNVKTLKAVSEEAAYRQAMAEHLDPIIEEAKAVKKYEDAMGEHLDPIIAEAKQKAIRRKHTVEAHLDVPLEGMTVEELFKRRGLRTDAAEKAAKKAKLDAQFEGSRREDEMDQLLKEQTKQRAQRHGAEVAKKPGTKHAKKPGGSGFKSGLTTAFNADRTSQFGRQMDPTDTLANTKMQYIEIYSTVAGLSIAFKAYITNYQDSFKSNWNAIPVYGKMDPIVSFINTERQIVCEFDIPASTPDEARQNMEKISVLTQFAYPSYGQGHMKTGEHNNIRGAPLVKVSFVNWIQTAGIGNQADAASNGIAGALEGVEFSPDMGDSGFFQGDADQVPAQGAYLYPKLIKGSFTLNVVHEHDLGFKGHVKPCASPRKVGFPYGLSTGGGTNFRSSPDIPTGGGGIPAGVGSVPSGLAANDSVSSIDQSGLDAAFGDSGDSGGNA